MIKIQFLIFRFRNILKSLSIKRKIFYLVVFFLLFPFFFYLIRNITSGDNKTVIVKKLPLINQIKNRFYGFMSSRISKNNIRDGGIIPGNTNITVSREQVSLSISSEEFSSIANAAKPVYVPITDVNTEFKNSIVHASALSFIIMPGKLSGSMKVTFGVSSRLPEFNEIDGYIDGIPAGEKLTKIFKTQGEFMLEKIPREYQVDLINFHITDDKLFVDAIVPEGIIYRQDGKLILDLTKKPALNN